MADHFLGLPRGALNMRAEAVTVGSVLAGAAVDVEIRWSDTNNLTQKDLEVLTEMLLKYVRTSGFDFKGTRLPALIY